MIGTALNPTLPVRRRGRRPVDTAKALRLRHIEVAWLILTTDIPVERIAARYGISRATAYRWRDLALTYDDPEADALHRLQPPA